MTAIKVTMSGALEVVFDQGCDECGRTMIEGVYLDDSRLDMFIVEHLDTLGVEYSETLSPLDTVNNYGQVRMTIEFLEGGD